MTSHGSCPVCYQPCATSGCTWFWCATYAGGPPPTAAAIGTCPHCSRSFGWHYFGCSSMPKHGNRACKDCSGANGYHTPSCRTKGYQVPSTGSQAPTQRPAAAPTGDCPCGRPRAGCDYHDPRRQSCSINDIEISGTLKF